MAHERVILPTIETDYYSVLYHMYFRSTLRADLKLMESEGMDLDLRVDAIYRLNDFVDELRFMGQMPWRIQ